MAWRANRRHERAQALPPRRGRLARPRTAPFPRRPTSAAFAKRPWRASPRPLDTPLPRSRTRSRPAERGLEAPPGSPKTANLTQREKAIAPTVNVPRGRKQAMWTRPCRARPDHRRHSLILRRDLRIRGRFDLGRRDLLIVDRNDLGASGLAKMFAQDPADFEHRQRMMMRIVP